MLWFVLALLTALLASFVDVFSKKSLQMVDEYIAAFSLRAFSLVILAPLLLIVEIPQLDVTFLYAFIAVMLIGTVSLVLFMRAIKVSPISLSIPMLAFTPVFLLVMSPLIVGEFPNSLGIIGILFIVAGSYFLNLGKRADGLAAPFKALIKEEGPRLMLCVAFLWSVGANIDKIAVLHSNPIFYAVTANLALALILVPMVLIKSTNNLKNIRPNLKKLAPIGILTGLYFILQLHAITMTLVVYVISIKRTSILLTILWGFLIFKEGNIKERFVSGSMMVVGVILIALSQI